MANHRNRFPARRRFLKQSTALTATVVALPRLARARPDEAPADRPGQPGAKQAGSAPLVPTRRRREPKR
jgi:hypothetical protein